jgi:hypothetical protein
VLIMAEESTGPSKTAKRNPRVAVFHVDEAVGAQLRDCFKQFNIDVICTKQIDILERQKFEGCVAPLYSAEGLAVLPAVRSSAWHRRMVIYGIGEATDLRKASQFGINVLMDYPVTRTSATKAIRSTRMLLLNEFRRYVRVPLATEIVIEQEKRRVFGTTLEISGGGMSVKSTEWIPHRDTMVRVTFRLPEREELKMTATICWEDRAAHQIGIRFASDAEGRDVVKGWIDEYLDLL